jgi:hypothetical protein
MPIFWDRYMYESFLKDKRIRQGKEPGYTSPGFVPTGSTASVLPGTLPPSDNWKLWVGISIPVIIGGAILIFLKSKRKKK